MKGSVFVIDSLNLDFFYLNSLVLISSDTLNLLKIFKIKESNFSYYGVIQSNKAFVVDGKLSFMFPNGMNFYITYLNDDMTINNTELIFIEEYFNSKYILGLSLNKYANNTLYLAIKRDYKISNDPFNFVTAITKFSFQYKSDEWDHRTFKERLSTNVSN